MITVLALVCSVNYPNTCQAISKGGFFRTVEECEADVGNALMYAESQGMYLRDYRCVVWGQPV